MRKLIIAIAVSALALGVAPAVADHEDLPGKSQWGRCKALTNGNGENKFANGQAFRAFDDVDPDNPGDFTAAYEYCLEYLADPDNHPSSGANGQGQGRPGNSNGNGNGNGG